MALTKDAILSADDLPREEVDVPEWNGSVFVRTMTAAERDSFEMGVMQEDGSKDFLNLRARLCARCLVDDKGERLFTDAEAVALGGKSAGALDRIFAVTQRLNGMSAEDVEELAKNLPGDPDEDSPSG